MFLHQTRSFLTSIFKVTPLLWQHNVEMKTILRMSRGVSVSKTLPTSRRSVNKKIPHPKIFNQIGIVSEHSKNKQLVFLTKTNKHILTYQFNNVFFLIVCPAIHSLFFCHFSVVQLASASALLCLCVSIFLFSCSLLMKVHDSGLFFPPPHIYKLTSFPYTSLQPDVLVFKKFSKAE